MEKPKPDEVRAEVEKIIASGLLRGPRFPRLFRFLVEECLKDGGKNLNQMHIGHWFEEKEAELEAITTKYDKLGESTGKKYGYPTTRVYLRQIRRRLMTYFEKGGYRDLVAIKLNSGSYVPVIAYNPVARGGPDLEPAVANLIWRAKMAVDKRSLRGALRAAKYAAQIPVGWENPRQVAGMLFTSWVAAPIAPGVIANDIPFAEMAVSRIKSSGLEPWECIFIEACILACRHEWRRALDVFELAVTNSLGEAKYFWWYTALLACNNRTQEAIDILDSGVRHFLRNNLAAMTDLALLLMMDGRFQEAEQMLDASLDFVSSRDPRVAYSAALLFEAQDRLEIAAAAFIRMYEDSYSGITEAQETFVAALWSGEVKVDALFPKLLAGDPETEALLWVNEAFYFIEGMLALILGRMSDTEPAHEIVAMLLRRKALVPTAPSVEIAIAMIGIGKFDDAVGWLRKAAFEEHDPMAMWFHIFPPLRHLRENRGFKALLKELNLSPQRSR